MMLTCPSKECEYNDTEDGCQYNGIILLCPADYSIRCEAYKPKNEVQK